nr:probable G-protein coupled receptor 156 isoform X2 [Pogona vitticeps]
MWLHKGLRCAMETGFNYSNLCDKGLDFKTQEQQQKTLQDLCTIKTAFSESSCKNSSPSFSAALLGVVLVFLTSGVLLSSFFLVFTIRFRNNRLVKMSSPNLNIVTLLGSGLTYSSAYLFGIEIQNSMTKSSMEMLVQARLCLLCIGSSLAFGPILGKSWRLYKVFTQQVPDKRVIIKDFQLLVMVSVVVLVDIILLLIWIFLDPVQCLQWLTVDMQVTEKGMTCIAIEGYFCMSLYSDFWLILFLGFKGSLLIYGAYLAGLTDDLSCPPVNQSLTLTVAVAITFFCTGLLLVVNWFFHLWHNLVVGFISGGIFVCTSTINCLIFIPQQVREVKDFTKQKDDIGHMAKYFTNSSKNLQSAMYSDEEIYQLLGEKHSMIQQLAEKNTAIAFLQEEVNSAKEKLMRLTAAETHSDADSLHFLQTHSAANCSSAVAEKQPQDSSSPGQEQKTRQTPGFPNSQCRLGLCHKKESLHYLEYRTRQTPAHITAKCRLMNDCTTDDYASSRRGQDQSFSQFTNTLTVGTIQAPHRDSPPRSGEKAEQANSSPMTPNQLPEITCKRSKMLQETLQDLSMNHIHITEMHSRGHELNEDYDMSLISPSQEVKIDIKQCSPCTVTRKTVFPMTPNTVCTENKMQTSCSGLTKYSHMMVSATKDRCSLHQLSTLSAPALKNMLQYKTENLLYLDNTRNPHPHKMLTHKVLGSFYLCPDSDSGSSSSGTTPPLCHHRHYCKVCHDNLSSSSDSGLTNIGCEPGMAQDYYIKPYGKTQPIVNFNEDLEPTYV